MIKRYRECSWHSVTCNGCEIEANQLVSYNSPFVLLSGYYSLVDNDIHLAQIFNLTVIRGYITALFQ